MSQHQYGGYGDDQLRVPGSESAQSQRRGVEGKGICQQGTSFAHARVPDPVHSTSMVQS